MKTLFPAIIFSAVCFSLQAQTLISKTLIASFSKQEIDSVLTVNNVPTFIFSTRLGVDAYKITYYTEDFDSTLKVATGLMVVPQNLNCPLSIINYSHGTTSVKEDVPSRLNGEGRVGLVAGSNGFVMCEPDYFGMGDGDWPHYYLHAYTQGMANINLLRAVKEACAELNITLNDELFLTGYSQGGYSTMVTHQYIEKYFADEFTVSKSFPGAGSYDMSGAMADLMVSDVRYPSPGYLPFLLFTWNPVYNLFSDPAEYFKAPYDSILPTLIDGTRSIGYINGFMPDTPKLIFHQHVIDSFIANPNHPLRNALRDNDIYEWVPQAPMLMVHCANDRQVPIENTQNAYTYFIQNGATGIDTTDLNPSLGHGDCGQVYLIYLKGYLDSIAAADPCISATGIAAKNIYAEIKVFPNPAGHLINIDFTKTNSPYNSLQLFDISGRVVYEENNTENIFTTTKKIDVQHFQPGIYMLKVTGNEGVYSTRVAVR